MTKTALETEPINLDDFTAEIDPNLFYYFPVHTGLRARLWQQLAAILEEHNPHSFFSKIELAKLHHRQDQDPS